MSLAADQISYRMLRQMLHRMLQERMDADETGSVACRAIAALYTLLLEHRIDRRGRCTSCRRPGVVVGRRRRCRVYRVAHYWMYQLDPELLVSCLVSELGLSVPPLVVRPEPDWPGLTITGRSEQDDTVVLPRIASEQTAPLSQAPVLPPSPSSPGGGFPRAGWPDSDQSGTPPARCTWSACPGRTPARCGAHHVLRGAATPRADRDRHPGTGMPCTVCVVDRVAGSPPPGLPDPAGQITPGMSAATAAATYRHRGWPVTQRAGQVHLTLGRHAVALLVPAALAAETSALLAAPLAHPTRSGDLAAPTPHPRC